ncbi:phosphopyruvate hydratase [Candidatus Woesearchaeota archaeon]|nr:phosphopyruvate hydratase [Candidatus Woesearchaeota archaeon]
MYIRKVHAREILDSRGNPTVEVEVSTKVDRTTYTAREEVPAGASTGLYEAKELRDGGKRYRGLGVQKAVNIINTKIKPRLTGLNLKDQRQIDNIMIDLDRTKNKSKLGANSMLGVSLACARLSAMLDETPLYHKFGGKLLLPVPFLNIINGGKHAQNDISFQEYMIAPHGKNFAESLRIGAEVYHELKKIIAAKHGKSFTNVGDEGGFAPNLSRVEEPLRLIMQAVTKLGYKRKIKLAIDAAASEFYYARKGYYVNKKYISGAELSDLYKRLAKSYPIISIEDPFEQNDFENFFELTKKIGKKVQIVGDDLLVTNQERIKKAISGKYCNALLLKPNQIGTLTEALDSAALAMRNRWKVMVSHRSGETNSSFIADLAVGIGCGQIKAGAPCRGERLAKYNQLLRIEEELGKKAKYAGKRLF